MSYQLVSTEDHERTSTMDPSTVTFNNGGESMSPTLLSPNSSSKLASKPPMPTEQITQPQKPNLIVATQISNNEFSPQVTVEVGSALSPETQKTTFVANSRAFIQIVGLPNGSDPSLVDTVVVHSANVDSPQPLHPQLSPNSAENYLVDMIDAEDEDPFTLESFDSLMEVTAEKGKDFIMARVVTVDPHDDTKFYHSYYAAHHINKVLFRTQPEEGLLHRMKAKNPLNNMTIVGDVHYYVISPESYQAARAHLSKSSTPGILSPASPTSRQLRRDKLFGKKRSTVAEMIRNALFSSDQGSRDQRKLHLVVTQPDKVLDIGDKKSYNQNTNQKPQPPDEMKNEKNGRRPSADDIYAFVSKSSPIEEKSEGLRGLDLSLLVPHDHPNSDERGRSKERSGNDREPRSKSTTDAHFTSPQKELDWVDRFYSRSLLQHRKGGNKIKVRSTSYRNERLLQLVNESSGSSTHHVLSVEEWVSIHCGDQVTDLLTTKPKQINSGLSSQTSSSPRSPTARQRRGKAGSPTQISDDLIHLKEVKKSAGASAVQGTAPGKSTPDSKRLPLKYVAKFFATDDDYLMKSSVRTYFKQNAVEAEDSVLFTIPSSTTVVLPHEANDDSLEPHPALNGFSYSIQEENDFLNNSLVLRVRRFMRHHHVLKISLLLYIIAGSLLIKFLIPQNLTYLVSFLLVFVLCFFLVFFVECDL